MPYYLKRSETEYSDYMPMAIKKPADRNDGVWIEGKPDGLIQHAPVDIETEVRKLYELLPLDIQEKYEEEILFGAEWLSRGNTAMVARKLTKAQAKLDQGNAVEVKMFNDISKLLGAS